MISSGDEYDAEPMPTDILEDIRDNSKSRQSINRREARYKISDCIKRGQVEFIRALLSTRNMGKVLHKIFKSVVNEMLQA